MNYSKLFSAVLVSLILSIPSALAFEVAGNIYRISGDISAASGTANSTSFRLVESSLGSISGIANGTIYMLNAGISLPMKLTFLLVAPTFSPAEILVHFWRK